MIVMNHNDIKKILKAGKKFTDTNPVVDHHPQKEDPNRILIVAVIIIIIVITLPQGLSAFW